MADLAQPGPSVGPEQQPTTPDNTGAQETGGFDALDTALEDFDTSVIESADAKQQLDSLVKAAKDNTAEQQEQGVDATKDSLKKAAQSHFYTLVETQDEASALAEVNKDFAPLGIQFTADENYDLSIADAAPSPESDRYEFISPEDLESIGKTLQEIARIFKEIMDAINKGLSGAKNSIAIGNNPEQGPAVPANGAEESVEGPSENGNDLSHRTAEDITSELDSMESAENLNAEEKQLLQELATIGGEGDTDSSDDTSRIDEINTRLKEINKLQERRTELENELQDRKDIVDNHWNEAKAKGLPDDKRLISDVTLEGDELVLSIDAAGDPEQKARIEDKISALGNEAGLRMEGNKIILTAPPEFFDDVLASDRQELFDAIANVPKNAPSTASEGEAENPVAEENEAEKPATEEKNVKKVRLILEQNRQRVEKQYNEVDSGSVSEKRDAAQAVIAALDAEITFLKENNVSVSRTIDGESVSLVDRLEEKRNKYADKLKELSKGASATEADPDDISDSNEAYTRKRVEAYRITKEDAYKKDPSRENAQLVIDAIDAELAYLDATGQDPMRYDEKGDISLQDRLKTKREKYLNALRKGTKTTSEEAKETTQESDRAAAPEKEQVLTSERANQIRNDMARIIGERSGLSAREQVVVRNAVRITDSGNGEYTVTIEKGLLNRGEFTEQQQDAIVRNLYDRGNQWASFPMDAQEMEDYYSTFVTRVNRAFA